MAADEPAPSGLFGVFILAIYSLVLIPYTLYRVCASGEEKTQSVAVKGKGKGSSWQDRAAKLCTKGNLLLLLAWAAWAGLLLYVQASSGDAKPFDPFDILGVQHGASDKEIKKAYRKLSLQFHPDKNPDPNAAKYFASHISKAYAALTDEVSRKNYEKYGHPDGPQGMNMGVALPSWMFNKDKKAAPIMLLGLVGGGILLPLAIVSYFMLKGDPYVGPNRIHQHTIACYAMSKYAIKESQSLVRIPETLLVAMEFIQMYTPNDHGLPMEELRRLLAPRYTEVMGKDKKAFWQRVGSVIKAHMLLLAHLERLGDEVPPQLQPDLRFVRQKCVPLLEEMAKIACLPRNNMGWGWMTPALACVEMMQCVASALPVGARKAGAKSGDALAPLLALPHFDQDVVKRLRKQRILTLKELQALPDWEQTGVLSAAGVTGDAADDVAAALQALPQVGAAVEFEVDGEEEICERDPVHCKVRLLLSRRSHASPGFKLRGSSVRAFTPCNPEPQDEAWYIFLTDPTNNWVIAFAKANLLDAEREGLEHPEAMAGVTPNNDVISAATAKAPAAPAAAPALPPPAGAAGGGGSGGGAAGDGGGKKQRKRDEPGQVVDLVFIAPPSGRYDWVLHVMSSTWVGADLALPARLRVNPLTRAMQEGRDPKTVEKRRQDSDSEDGGDGGGRGSDSGSGSDEDEEEVPSDEYDSEETGEEVSSDEEGGGGGAAGPAADAAAGGGAADGKKDA